MKAGLVGRSESFRKSEASGVSAKHCRERHIVDNGKNWKRSRGWEGLMGSNLRDILGEQGCGCAVYEGNGVCYLQSTDYFSKN